MEPYYKENAATIYKGHSIEILKQLPDENVQMAITSPPYWGLRNYTGGTDIIWGGDENCEHEWSSKIPPPNAKSGKHQGILGAVNEAQDSVRFTGNLGQFCSLCGAWRGQLGLEPTPELYVEHLMMIFREVKRVLRRDGSFYLNVGDTYASGTRKSNKSQTIAHGNKQDLPIEYSPSRDMPDYKPKCMVCIPERVMFAMIDDEWILRNKIVWHKPNAMPSSVKDRFTTTWEYVFFFTKARRYYFDLDAVRVPHTTQSLERYQRGINLDDLFGHGPNPPSFNLRVRDVKRGKGGATAQSGELKASEKEIGEYEYPEKYNKISPSDIARKYGYDPEGICPVCGRTWKRHASPNAKDRVTGLRREFIPCVVLTKHDEAVDRTGNVSYTDPLHTRDYSPKGKNPGDVIEATTIRHKSWMSTPGHPYTHKATGKPQNPGDYWEITTQPFKGAHFAVFPEALCVRPILASTRVSDVVLDMFAGSGTTGVVAKRLGRRAILIDCVEEYCKIAKDRLSKVEYQPGLELG